MTQLVEEDTAFWGRQLLASASYCVLPTTRPPEGKNPCEGKKPDLPDVACVVDDVLMTGEQSGTNVTKGYKGNRNTTAVPITVPYFQVGLCPVNVHWHLGTEHYSLGEFDETGTGPSDIHERRRLAGKVRLGFQCKLYDEKDAKFTEAYHWQHCKDMEVGQTYEVHWPHLLPERAARPISTRLPSTMEFSAWTV
jgi:hypothetical protein